MDTKIKLTEVRYSIIFQNIFETLTTHKIQNYAKHVCGLEGIDKSYNKGAIELHQHITLHKCGFLSQEAPFAEEFYSVHLP